MPTANFDRLRLLHAVATLGTIAAAARAHAYTASAVSQQLAALEREVGTSLLERSNRGVSLTPAGRVLSEHAAVILDLVQVALADVGQTVLADSPTSDRVGAFPTAITSMLLPVVEQLSSVVPLQIADLEPDQALAALAARTIDAWIVDHFDQVGLADHDRVTGGWSSGLATLPPGVSVSNAIATNTYRHVEFVTRHVPRRNAALAAVEAALRGA